MVAAALIDHGQVLLARRAPHKRWYANLWDLPGGHVEAGETEAQAVVREVSEELGVIISEPTGSAVTHLFDYASSGARIADLSVWLVTDWIGDVKNNSPREHLELQWFVPQDLPKIEIAHAEYVSLLADILASR
jgi:8-oxo-dGTP diphosphatase